MPHNQAMQFAPAVPYRRPLMRALRDQVADHGSWKVQFIRSFNATRY